MKQFWFGLGLIGLILISGLLLGQRLEDSHFPQAKDLERASACARKEDWAQAEALVKRAQKNWENSRCLAAAAVHHQMIDDIDTRFGELEVYVSERSRIEFTAGCATLARQLRKLPRSHSFDWWNLL